MPGLSVKIGASRHIPRKFTAENAKDAVGKKSTRQSPVFFLRALRVFRGPFLTAATTEHYPSRGFLPIFRLGYDN